MFRLISFALHNRKKKKSKHFFFTPQCSQEEAQYIIKPAIGWILLSHISEEWRCNQFQSQKQKGIIW